MSTLHKTPTAALMELHLRNVADESLVDVVLGWVEAGVSFREIALRLRDQTGIRVSHETVRSWAVEWRHEAAA